MAKEEQGKPVEKPILPTAGKMDRRDFFVNTGKLIIPTIGIIGLTLSSLSKKVEAVSSWCSTCANGCSDSCTLNCSSSCEGFCKGGCGGTCKSGCEGFLRK